MYLLPLSRLRGYYLDAVSVNQGISNGQFIEDTVEPSYLPGLTPCSSIGEWGHHHAHKNC